MRPRQSSLGNSAGGARNSARAGRFNEAEAIKPRKLPSLSFPWPAKDGFNEAEAIKPRKQEQSRRHGLQ